MLQIPEMPSTGCGDDCAQVVEWIYDQLRGIDRVEFYRHAFTDQSLQSRTNVYGILRASPLADGKVWSFSICRIHLVSMLSDG